MPSYSDSGRKLKSSVDTMVDFFTRHTVQRENKRHMRAAVYRNGDITRIRTSTRRFYDGTMSCVTSPDPVLLFSVPRDVGFNDSRRIVRQIPRGTSCIISWLIFIFVNFQSTRPELTTDYTAAECS